MTRIEMIAHRAAPLREHRTRKRPATKRAGDDIGRVKTPPTPPTSRAWAWRATRSKSSYAATTARSPLPREVARRPGDVLHRMAMVSGESAEAAMVRARAMPWWPAVRSKRPQWARGWWCWAGAPMTVVASQGRSAGGG
mgnify:FL=1